MHSLLDDATLRVYGTRCLAPIASTHLCWARLGLIPIRVRVRVRLRVRVPGLNPHFRTRTRTRTQIRTLSLTLRETPGGAEHGWYPEAFQQRYIAVTVVRVRVRIRVIVRGT